MKAIVNGNPSGLRACGPVAQGATGWGSFEVAGCRLQLPVNGGAGRVSVPSHHCTEREAEVA